LSWFCSSSARPAPLSAVLAHELIHARRQDIGAFDGTIDPASWIYQFVNPKFRTWSIDESIAMHGENLVRPDLGMGMRYNYNIYYGEY
jgi:hypothetical protein